MATYRTQYSIYNIISMYLIWGGHGRADIILKVWGAILLRFTACDKPQNNTRDVQHESFHSICFSQSKPLETDVFQNGILPRKTTITVTQKQISWKTLWICHFCYVTHGTHPWKYQERVIYAWSKSNQWPLKQYNLPSLQSSSYYTCSLCFRHYFCEYNFLIIVWMSVWPCPLNYTVTEHSEAFSILFM